MAAVFLQLIHRGKGLLEPFNRVRNADPSEIPGGRDGKQIKADIGRGSAVGGHRFRNFLKIIRGKKMMLPVDEGFKKTPGLAGDRTKILTVGGNQGFTRE